MKPNPVNYCGGNYQNWLEVMLTSDCNGRCSWCIEKEGYHPTDSVSWEVLAQKILDSDKDHVILLGGEPTLYPHLSKLIDKICQTKKVFLTTNGSSLIPGTMTIQFGGLWGMNVSIHHYDLWKNFEITGIPFDQESLRTCFRETRGIEYRLNCNLIKGYIDSEEQIERYIDFAYEICAHRVRFAELKGDEENFVDAAKILDYKYGLNDNPFVDGCNTNTVINGMLVNFRQMCGLQTPQRPKPPSPEQDQITKRVLYYDGNFYTGWQRRLEMDDKKLKELLKKIAKGEKTPQEGLIEIKAGQQKLVDAVTVKKNNSGDSWCQY